MYSVLTKMRYKKQNWMQGQHNGKMVDFFNWPKFRLTKSVFFRAMAENRGTHVYPRMSKGYLEPLGFGLRFSFCSFLVSHLCMQIYSSPPIFIIIQRRNYKEKQFYFLSFQRESNSRHLNLQPRSQSSSANIDVTSPVNLIGNFA